MFGKSKISQSMIDAVNSVVEGAVEGKVETIKEVQMLEESSEKVATPTGMKVYGSSYGNSKKARQDQTKSPVDDLKGPKDREVKEDMTFAQKLVEKVKAKMQEKKDVVMPEEVRKSDVPAFLRKSKGEKPLTVADVKGPKKDTISAPENLAKARNEEVVNESFEEIKVHSKDGKHIGTIHHGKYQSVAYAHPTTKFGSSREPHPDEDSMTLAGPHDNQKGIEFIHAHHRMMKEEVEQIEEKHMTDADKAEQERIVRGMKKNLSGFKSRYGARAKDVMYATATKQAMEEDAVEEATIAGTPGWKEMKKDVKDKSGAVHTPMSRARDLARSAFNKVQDKTKITK